jgi:predicted ATPase
MTEAGPGLRACTGDPPVGALRYVVLTGGPGAGKTAVLTIARQRFCRHVRVMEEAASILFRGGFPRQAGEAASRAAQRAIYHVQVELEAVAEAGSETCVALCDRGTLDGLAYWPGDEADFFRGLGTTRAAELARYAAVVHLRTPRPEHYNHENPVRIESAAQAAAIDERILQVWRHHPHRVVIDSDEDFLTKAGRALAVVEAELPACCRHAGSDGPPAP